MTSPRWKDALPTPPAGGRLQEAWFTSFEPPEADLLVEHLLPSLLSGSYSLSQEPHARTLFFGELATTLELLHGRLTVISSPPRVAQGESLQYPWLWRYVTHFIVGAKSRAVQHAKLWAFHWKVNNEHHLELYVSSTNLTASAFKTQMQAGWQLMLPLSKQASLRTRRTWGSLVTFLEALGASAGDFAAMRLQRLIALLSRVECPPNVTFIASIPGQRCAARQLKPFEATELHILTPTIGEWNDHTLANWSADAGVAPEKIHVKWISKQHPWAAPGWALSNAACATLERNRVKLECLPIETRFAELHREADQRWSHAKLYLLRSRRKRALLVTSANWSFAAWGAGSKTPHNFELGVLLDSEWTEFEALGEAFDPPRTFPYCIDRTEEELNESGFHWAEASWDGKEILLRARSSNLDTSITAIVTFTGSLRKSVSLVDGAAVMPWNDQEHTPVTAGFTQGIETMLVNALDLRSPTHFAKTPLPEIDPLVATALREAFLLQRYGGPVVEPETVPGWGGSNESPTSGAPEADYAVQEWLDARTGFNVVDQWRSALAEAHGDPAVFERVRLDGEELQCLYTRRNGAAARLVLEELSWRLDEKA